MQRCFRRMPFKRNTISPANIPDVRISPTTESKLSLEKSNPHLRSKDTESITSGYSSTTALFLSDVAKNSIREDFCKVLLLLSLPLITILILASITIFRTAEVVVDADRTKLAVDINSMTTDLVTSLQVERGISTGILGSHETTDLALQFEKLGGARRYTDGNLTSLRSWGEYELPVLKVNNKTITTFDDLGAVIRDHRREVDALILSPEFNVNFFTQMNNAIIDSILQISGGLNGGHIWTLFVVRDLLLQATDLFGIERALGAQFYTSCHLESATVAWFSRVRSQGEQLLLIAFSYYGDLRSVYEQSVRDNDVSSSFLEEREVQILSNQDPCIDLSPREQSAQAIVWFDHMTRKIDSIILTRSWLASEIVSTTSTAAISAKWKTSICVVGLFLTILICLISGAWYARETYTNLRSVAVFAEELAERTRDLKKEKKRAQLLLLQILPEPVCDRLQQGLGVPAEHYDLVTIYFSDIVGFTTIAAQRTPMEIIELLNALYSLFDHCIDLYNVYKVETIGDAYMVASGLPVRHEGHAAEIGCMAVDLLNQVEQFHPPHIPDEKLALRIGINTGPCVAGVVGIKMPRYCLFGDTVNTASRMESTGQAFRIHISEATKLALESSNIELTYKASPRGIVSVKGKGKMSTYWLEECRTVSGTRHPDIVRESSVSWFDMEQESLIPRTMRTPLPGDSDDPEQKRKLVSRQKTFDTSNGSVADH